MSKNLEPTHLFQFGTFNPHAIPGKKVPWIQEPRSKDESEVGEG